MSSILDVNRPAMFAYQVWEWTTSTSGTAAAMATSVPSTRSAAFAPGGNVSAWAVAPGRGSPMQWTSTSSQRDRRWATNCPTCTPAPP